MPGQGRTEGIEAESQFVTSKRLRGSQRKSLKALYPEE
jgi:hypothetical protein